MDTRVLRLLSQAANYKQRGMQIMQPSDEARSQLAAGPASAPLRIRGVENLETELRKKSWALAGRGSPQIPLSLTFHPTILLPTAIRDCWLMNSQTHTTSDPIDPEIPLLMALLMGSGDFGGQTICPLRRMRFEGASSATSRDSVLVSPFSVDGTPMKETTRLQSASAGPVD